MAELIQGKSARKGGLVFPQELLTSLHVADEHHVVRISDELQQLNVGEPAILAEAVGERRMLASVGSG